MDKDGRVSPEDSARMRDLLASNRTLLAWIRTSLSFAGLGFVVARFGRTQGAIGMARPRRDGHLRVVLRPPRGLPGRHRHLTPSTR
jgi:uncharacterized membrane protein YidH (DUF202 family)